MASRGETLHWVSNEPLRRRFEESGESLSDLATRLGWRSTTSGSLQTSRVARTLGLMERTRGRTQSVIRYETAVALAKALHMDPFEAGV